VEVGSGKPSCLQAGTNLEAGNDRRGKSQVLSGLIVSAVAKSVKKVFEKTELN